MAAAGWLTSIFYSPPPSNSTLLAILFGSGKFFTTWPLLPYFVLVVMGWSCGRWAQQLKSYFLLLGAGCLIAGLAYEPSRQLALHPRFWGTREMNTHAGVSLLAGAVFWIGLHIAAANYWDRFKWVAFVTRCGNGILWGYVGHICLGLPIARWATQLWPTQILILNLCLSLASGIMCAQLGEKLGQLRIRFQLRPVKRNVA